jgi:hypothetical protein
MTPAEYRANKAEIERQMRRYDKNFVAKEFAYNKVSNQYGEITMQNLAGITVEYHALKTSKFKFKTQWGYRDCILFDNEKEMLVHKLKNA